MSAPTFVKASANIQNFQKQIVILMKICDKTQIVEKF